MGCGASRAEARVRPEIPPLSEPQKSAPPSPTKPRADDLLAQCSSVLEGGKLAELKALLEAGPSLISLHFPDDRATLLLRCLAQGERRSDKVVEEMALWLIDCGANVRAADAEGRTPLLLAAEHGLKHVVARLLAEGVNPLPSERDPSSRFPFVAACRHSHIDICGAPPPRPPSQPPITTSDATVTDLKPRTTAAQTCSSSAPRPTRRSRTARRSRADPTAA